MLLQPVVLSVGAGLLLLLSATGFAQQDRPTISPSQQPKEVASLADARTPIALSDDEVDFIRREMRGFLESIQEILDATGANDQRRVVAASRRVGMNGSEATHIPPALAPKLLMEFKKLGLATHRGFDQIALDAEKIGASEHVYRQLADVMNHCTACHSTWRIFGDTRR